MSTKSWLFLQNLSFKLKHDVLPRNHFSSWLQSTLSCFQIVFGDASEYWLTFGKRLFDGDDDIVQSNHMSNLSLICHNGRWGENNKSEHKIVHHTDEIYFTTNKWNTEPHPREMSNQNIMYVWALSRNTALTKKSRSVDNKELLLLNEISILQ